MSRASKLKHKNYASHTKSSVTECFNIIPQQKNIHTVFDLITAPALITPPPPADFLPYFHLSLPTC